MYRRGACFCLLSLAVITTLALRAAEPARVDRYGDPLPLDAQAQLGTVRLRHGQGIECVAYSRDGKFLASGGHDRLIYLWDTQSGRKIRQFEGHPESVKALAFSPDGKLLASGSQDDLRLWDAATGKLRFQLGEKGQAAYSVAFSPDGKTIASAHHNNTVRLWDAQTGKSIRTWAGTKENNAVASVAFSPNGTILAAVGYDGAIRVWDPKTGTELKSWKNPNGGLWAVAFSPDGTLLAAGGSGGIRLYRPLTGEEVRLLEGQRYVHAIAFYPDGKTLVSGDGEDKTIRLWDVDTGKERRRLPDQNSFVTTVAVSPDGRTIATSGYFWDRVVHLWDARTGESKQPSVGHLGSVHQVAFLRDGASVISHGEMDAQAFVWPRGTGKEMRPLPLPEGFNACRFSLDRSTLAVTTERGVCLLCELPTGREISRCQLGKGARLGAISTDRTRIAVHVEEDAHEVWDLKAGKRLHRFSVPKYGVDSLTFSPDGRMLAGARPGEDVVLVWDLETGKELCCCKGHSDSIFGLAFSADGRMLASSSEDCTIRLWETATGKERLRLQGHKSWVWSPTFSPDGKTLASASDDRTARLWDVGTGKELYVFRGHLGRVFSVDFSPDGRRLVSGSEDTTALIWNIPQAVRDRKPPALVLDQAAAEKLWTELASKDGAKAYAAMQRLGSAPAQAVPLCKKQLAADEPPAPEQIERWIVSLDDDDFAVREKASRELKLAGAWAETALRRALKAKPSQEARRRIGELLNALDVSPPSPAVVQRRRAIEMLERIGSPEAVEVLRRLERQARDPRLLREAKASLRRLSEP